jgi:nucleoside-diphosphate-sugar epimerase
MPPPVILLGLGFTTRRLARRLLARGLPTFAAVRNVERFSELTALGLQVAGLNREGYPRNSILVHTVPPLPVEESHALRHLIAEVQPRRVVYISSTGVYGSQTAVDENTSALPSDEKARLRIDEEEWLRAGAWELLIVRPAAIYGPGRGVHVRIAHGRLPRAEPGSVTSRIHVDDLAAVIEAGALSDLTGAWPLADDHACATSEIAAWCAGIMGLDLSEEWREKIPVWGRRVDGRKIRELLGVELRYPGHEAGILACVAEENARAGNAQPAWPSSGGQGFGEIEGNYGLGTQGIEHLNQTGNGDSAHAQATQQQQQIEPAEKARE